MRLSFHHRAQLTRRYQREVSHDSHVVTRVIADKKKANVKNKVRGDKVSRLWLLHSFNAASYLPQLPGFSLCSIIKWTKSNGPIHPAPTCSSCSTLAQTLRLRSHFSFNASAAVPGHTLLYLSKFIIFKCVVLKQTTCTHLFQNGCTR